MKPGPKPKPSHLKLIEGNRGKKPIGEDWVQPKTRSSALAPPDHLDKIAKAEWRRLAKEMTDLGTLTNIDRAAFAAYCAAWSTAVQAQVAIDKQGRDDPTTLGGLLAKTSNGNLIQNPLIGIRNRALRDLMRYAAEFGFTPSSRANVQAVAPAAARQAAAAAARKEAQTPGRKFFGD